MKLPSRHSVESTVVPVLLGLAFGSVAFVVIYASTSGASCWGATWNEPAGCFVCNDQYCGPVYTGRPLSESAK